MAAYAHRIPCWSRNEKQTGPRVHGHCYMTSYSATLMQTRNISLYYMYYYFFFRLSSWSARTQSYTWTDARKESSSANASSDDNDMLYSLRSWSGMLAFLFRIKKQLNGAGTYHGEAKLWRTSSKSKELVRLADEKIDGMMAESFDKRLWPSI